MYKKSIYLVFTVLLLCAMDCGLNGSGKITSEEPQTCAEREEETSCEKHVFRYGVDLGNCIWRYDKCLDMPEKGAPHIPAGLAKLKVKQIAVGEGFCAIDENDQLWCVHPYTHDKKKWIFPAEGKKYKQVAMVDQYNAYRHVCATTADSKSVCFDGFKEVKGPTTSDVLKTIPGRFADTICAFDATNIYCESSDKAYENKLSKAIQNFRAAGGTTSTLEDIYLAGESYGTSADRRVFARLADNTLWLTKQDSTKADGWDLVNWAGPPLVNHLKDVKSFSSYGDIYAMAESTLNGVFINALRGLSQPDHGQIANIPDAVKNNKVAQIATTKEFACAILEGSGELLCWGKMKITKNLPANLNGVKSVAVSDKLVCYINKDDKIGCFGEE